MVDGSSITYLLQYYFCNLKKAGNHGCVETIIVDINNINNSIKRSVVYPYYGVCVAMPTVAL